MNINMVRKLSLAFVFCLAAFALMSLDMFADARPMENFRFFVKGSMDYSTDGRNGFFLKEAFADIQSGGRSFCTRRKADRKLGGRLFFQSGKSS